MLLPKFDYHEPTTLEEALRLLSSSGETPKLLAGGTDLLVRMKLKIDSPSTSSPLLGFPVSMPIIPRKHHGVTIGAAVTAAELACHELVRDRFAPLALAAAGSGHP